MPCIQLGPQHIFPDKVLPLPRFLHGAGGGSHGYQIQLMSSFRCQECFQPASPQKTGLKLKQNYTTWISSLFNRTYKLPATCKKMCGFERSSVYGTVMPGWPGWTQHMVKGWTQHMVKHHNTTHRTCHKYYREQNRTTDSKKHLKFKTTYKKTTPS